MLTPGRWVKVFEADYLVEGLRELPQNIEKAGGPGGYRRYEGYKYRGGTGLGML